MDLTSTIVAISTPPGRGGLGVLRLSGSTALPIAQAMVRLRAEPTARTAYLGVVLDSDGNPVDEVVVTWFSAPRSYTGEDVVEISCHGSPVVMNFCLERAVAAGARHAEPGEFTLRAYLRGRIDLPQAEAVRDLIDATTLYQAKVAARQKQGALSRRLTPIKQRLIDLIAMLEAGIDFAEDDITVAQTAEILRRIDDVLAEVRTMAKSFAWGRLVREGFSLAIVGAPNVGKSSLFNALLRQDRAIVTPIAGTTRDVVSENMEIGGIPVRLMDTAGIRNTDETVEKIGIEKSFEAISDASVTLVVVDSSSFEASDSLLAMAQPQGGYLLVWNKCDLIPSEIRENKVPSDAVLVSALTGEGMDSLQERIVALLSGGAEPLESGFVTSLRHKSLLDQAELMLEKARDAAETGVPHEMVLLDLYCSLEPLDSITGATTADDILNRIFSTFCIGK